MMKKGETWQTKYALQLSKRISDPRVNAVLESSQSRRESRKSDTSDDGRSRNTTSNSKKSFVRQNSESSLDNSTISDVSDPLSRSRKRAIPNLKSIKISSKRDDQTAIKPTALMRAASASALIDTATTDRDDKFIAQSLSRAFSSPLLLEKMSEPRPIPKILRRNSTYTLLDVPKSFENDKLVESDSNSTKNEKNVTAIVNQNVKPVTPKEKKDTTVKAENLKPSYEFNSRAYVGANAFFSFGYSAKKPTIGLAPRNLDLFGTGKAERSKLVSSI